MANQRHIQWLLEGTDSWNRRRKAQDFQPDFSAANLRDAFLNAKTNHPARQTNRPIQLPSVDLKRANLANAILGNAVLTNADLQDANCSAAYLYGANLSGSRLDNANFAGADLAYANLTGAVLHRANLSRADLTGIDFTGIDLTQTNLDGANLTGVEPVELMLKTSEDQRGQSERSPAYQRIITIDPQRRFGKPCIRGTRITVGDVLEYMASGMTQQEILSDFPELTNDDLLACFAFAAARERRGGRLCHLPPALNVATPAIAKIHRFPAP